jgi:hypothetical protein
MLGRVRQHLLEKFRIDSRVEVTVPIDDSSIRHPQEEGDQRMNLRVENPGIEVVARLERTRRDHDGVLAVQGSP